MTSFFHSLQTIIFGLEEHSKVTINGIGRMEAVGTMNTGLLANLTMVVMTVLVWIMTKMVLGEIWKLLRIQDTLSVGCFKFIREGY